MNIKFKQKHKSIKNFDDSNIENFSIFLGVNGSGKTHLLQALKEGFVSANNFPKESISYFNMQTFLIKNQKAVTHRNLDDEKMEAWNILNRRKQQFENFDNQIKQIVGEVESPYDIQVDTSQNQQYSNHKKSIREYIDKQSQNKPKIRKLLKTGIFGSGKYASELTQTDFFKFSSYNPDDYELLESLSEVFLDYNKKINKARLREIDGGEGKSDEEIQELEKKSPWNFINKMFTEFGMPEHTISYPEFKPADLMDSHAITFQVKIYVNDEEIDFEDLSSGEKILCALAITVYQDDKSEFPQLLLLDEIDASLHPSMIQSLLNVINEVFIKNDCNVILATHSPTTVALAREESLFEIQKGVEQQKIKKITQADAIDLLSEGVMTLEKGLKIFDSIFQKELTIISEGKNQKHIKQALEILDSKLCEKIQLYEHDSGSGAADLFGLFEFMKKPKITKPVLFIWDCDQQSKVSSKSDGEKVFKFCFTQNTSNQICKKGIENLYPAEMFTDDVTKKVTIEEGGKVKEIIEFSENQKDKFIEKIENESDKSKFNNFNPMIAKIKEIIGEED